LRRVYHRAPGERAPKSNIPGCFWVANGLGCVIAIRLLVPLTKLHPWQWLRQTFITPLRGG
jgi:hypothetical protein